MKKELLIRFAQNNRIKIMRNSHKNKFWGIIFLIMLPIPFTLKLGLPVVWITGVCLSVIALLISIFANKIGYFEVLNNAGAFFCVGVYYPFIFLICSNRLLNSTLLITIVSAFDFILALFISGIYLSYKTKKYNENGLNTFGKSNTTKIILWVMVTIVSVSLIRTILSGMQLASIGIFLIILSSVMMIFCVPLFLSSVLQLIVLKKYKLNFNDK